MKFKPGDKIKCVKPNGRVQLHKDVNYTVKSRYDEYEIFLVGVEGSFFDNRFELISKFKFEKEEEYYKWLSER